MNVKYYNSKPNLNIEENDLLKQFSTLLKKSAGICMDLTYFTLSMKREFEPYGRATENWDIIWYLEAPHIQAFWKSTNGWVQCNPGVTARWSGVTSDEALSHAIHELSEHEIIWLHKV